MSASTPKSGLTYPSLADSPNVPASLQTLATDLDGIVIPKYTSSIAQTAANPSPATGDMCYRYDLDCYQQWDGTAWNNITLGAWQPYTPTWSGLSALGASVARGLYAQVGKTCFVTADLEWGTGSTLGTGSINVSLPIQSATVSGDMGWQGTGKFRDASAVWHPLLSDVGSAATFASVMALSSSQSYVAVGSGSGYTWTSATSYMRIQMTYQTV